MNICTYVSAVSCTYVSAVSMKPKRYAVAVFHGTKTLKNLKSNKNAVLQLLGEEQYPLIRMLGKTSGKQYDKSEWLSKRNRTIQWKGHTVLKDASAYIQLSYHSEINAGDHHLYIFDVIAYKSNSEHILTTEILSQKKLIRI